LVALRGKANDKFFGTVDSLMTVNHCRQSDASTYRGLSQGIRIPSFITGYENKLRRDSPKFRLDLPKYFYHLGRVKVLSFLSSLQLLSEHIIHSSRGRNEFDLDALAFMLFERLFVDRTDRKSVIFQDMCIFKTIQISSVLVLRFTPAC